MKNQKFTICNKSVYPGEIANLAMPLPERYQCSPLYMPIKVINGVKPGPKLLILSVLRGNEFNGLETTNRISKMIDPKKLSGTLITIPVVNVYGLTNYPNSLTVAQNLANCFPGNVNGNFGERIAHTLTEEILKQADYCIEVQTGAPNHMILPQIYCNFDNKKSTELAKVFNAPVITNVDIHNNQLRKTAEELQIPMLVYQAGEALRFDENAISLGVDGVQNVMKSLNMLEAHAMPDVKPMFSRDEDWIVAHKSGILHANVTLGTTIHENQVIGTITDPFGNDMTETIKSPQKGIVVGINASPLIQEGSEIFKIASFLDHDKAESVIEKWDSKQPDSFIS